MIYGASKTAVSVYRPVPSEFTFPSATVYSLAGSSFCWVLLTCAVSARRRGGRRVRQRRRFQWQFLRPLAPFCFFVDPTVYFRKVCIFTNAYSCLSRLSREPRRLAASVFVLARTTQSKLESKPVWRAMPFGGLDSDYLSLLSAYSGNQCGAFWLSHHNHQPLSLTCETVCASILSFYDSPASNFDGTTSANMVLRAYILLTVARQLRWQQ